MQNDDADWARRAVFRAAGWHYTPDQSMFTHFERGVLDAAARALAAARREMEETFAGGG